ncbi:phosphate signaling complex protein PhoU [Actinospica durhamensis]|uniref:Phosphate-specific transport system accessory protein PhoU n=1 Tax=Actinospica durhamensis TaxID=1508375 RepID=A0A941EII9_9ACTN|nr:phosphate signaling complex protein PhoU [Actinospica durhamensis]MBR7831861.1 phosphate signaling complex protein PhoU [Actinospica durhamensis]
MRDAYHEQLDSVGHTLVEMAGLVGRALSRATTALLEADLATAEAVISADDAVDALHRELDVRTLDLMARQQPVAGDLRTLVTSLRMSADLERMGDLARHIAKVARMRYPEHAVPQELRPIFEQMGEIGAELAENVARIVEDKDVEAARGIEARDDAVDRLHSAVFMALLAQDSPHTTESAIDVTLLSRYYERFADHAVSVARRLVFLVTGEQ